MPPLQTVTFTATEATAHYKGRPVYRVTDPAKIQQASNLARLSGESAAADYIISVGEGVE